MSADRVVIDASVAIAFLRDEVHTSSVRAAIAAWASQPVDLLVPINFWLEVVNALMRRHGFSFSRAVEGVVALDRLGLQTIEIDRPMLLLAMKQMEGFGLSAYDAVYLAVARSTGSALATLDARLAEAAGEHGLFVSDEEPRRLSEAPAPYQAAQGAEPGWAHSAVVGAEIARLRREFAAR